MGKRPHEPGRLAAVAVKRLADGWHADGGNLYLFVRGNSRTWVFRYTAPDGQRRNMGLGSLTAVGLSTARDFAKLYRAQAKHPTEPTDPISIRQQSKDATKLAKAKRMTFEQCATAYIEAQRAGWKNAKHAQQWANTLETYACPVFGSLPVASIDTALVVKCLTPIWITKTETASRVRGRIEKVLDWATTSKYRQGENPARWRGHLDTLLAPPTKVVGVEHHAALPFAQLGAFMVALRKMEGLGARALEFVILTAARSGEVRGASWDEIDLTDKVWVLPAARMKMRREHRVPLSEEAIVLLQALPRIEGTDLLFPNTKGTALSDMTLTAVLRRMKRAVTAHGFRSTFRDWASERTNYPRDVCEMALAHAIGDKVEAAYRRGDLFAKRRRMMKDWAKFCGTVPQADGVVVPLRGVA